MLQGQSTVFLNYFGILSRGDYQTVVIDLPQMAWYFCEHFLMSLWVVKTFLFILLILWVYVEKCMNLFSSIELYKTLPEDILMHTMTHTKGFL